MANAGDIIITEIMANPNAVLDADGEWFEIFNTTSSAINLSGWTISDAGTDTHTIGSLIIPAGGFAVLGRNLIVAVNGGVDLDYVFSGFVLGNTADEIILKDNLGTTIDTVTYATTTIGASRELNAGSYDATSNDNAANWSVATAPYGDGDLGTPGTGYPPANDPPTDIGLSNALVQEFRANGTVVGNLSATDPDIGDTFTFALLDNAAGRFSIVGNELRVANGLLLDFEQNSSHAIAVRVTDTGGNTFTKNFTITIGDVNPEIVTGNVSANILFGGALADNLKGVTGNDTLRGNAGNDVLTGGLGRDTMTGNAGLDDFDFNALAEMGKTASTRDRITDFQHLQDDIDLRTIDASTKAGGNQAFTFIGTSAFHKVAGELHAVKINANGTANDKTVVEGDVNGDGKADFQIELTGLKALTAADFLL